MPRLKELLRIIFLVGATFVGLHQHFWAWDATGHEWVSGIAIEMLPDNVPAFLRTSQGAAEIAVLGRELDRSKGAGRTHDAERDPAIISTWLMMAR